ncbi:MAG: MucB/RseB C-terminal domain-containing protein [Pseudomonadota bacterium]
MKRRLLTLPAFLAALSAHAAPALPPQEAAAWLQKISDASRRMPYEGLFVFQHGGSAQTLMVSNRPNSGSSESRLLTMDGTQREVRCTQQASVTLMVNGNQQRLERRLNKRHFPDLLPENAAPLANWYSVRSGSADRVAGRDCGNVEILPKDAYRWGYVLCVDRNTGFPLRAVMINGEGRPLMQYSFAEVRLGTMPRVDNRPIPAIPETARPVANERVEVNGLPPGFTRIAAVRRQLPNLSGEVEHWVFSDGLTHLSLFLEPAHRPAETIKGQSKQGMINMIKRPLGDLQATVLGEAPMATVETIAMGLEAKP